MRSMGSQGPKVSSCGQHDLSLRWAHSHFVGFVMSWLILCLREVIIMIADKNCFPKSEASDKCPRTSLITCLMIINARVFIRIFSVHVHRRAVLFEKGGLVSDNYYRIITLNV